MLKHRYLFLLILLLSIPFLHSQTGNNSSQPTTTIKSAVRVVLVDIVVSDKNNNPVTGLDKSAFQIFEQGKQQTIASFEEHGGESTAPVSRSLSPLPPHVFSNEPIEKPLDSVNLLLLDALNTELNDQSYVHAQMVKYLKTIEPGPRLAIVTLSSHLRLVQGFTTDPRILLAALNQEKTGGGPQASPMLSTAAENNSMQQLLTEMVNGHAPDDAIAALKNFQEENKASRDGSRIELTLQALQQLARYLGGFNGRKNIIWFAGSFPTINFPSTSKLTDIGGADTHVSVEIRKTINALASSQVAIYPVSSQGIETDSIAEAAQVSTPQALDRNMTPGQRAVKGQNEQLRQDIEGRFFKHDSMDQMAKNTGGEAFYNSNGLKEAFAQAVHQGAHYYRISYSPSNKKMDGRYRGIEVKLSGGTYKLAYRRGYYSENAKQATNDQPATPADPLQPLMARGLPDSTQILYLLRATPSAIAGPGTTVAGDNKNLRDPVTHITAEFMVPIETLGFELSPDGVRRGNVELALVAYDHEGTALNWLYRSIRTSLKPELYMGVTKTGARFRQEIDIPKGELFLRAGIYDLESGNAGTIEIPLAHLDNSASLAKNVQPVNPDIASPAQSSAPSEVAAAAPASMATPSTVTSSAKDQPGALVNTLDTKQPTQPALVPDKSTGPAGESGENISTYCATLPGSAQQSQALSKVCESVLSTRAKLPNIICDREMKRNWKTSRSLPGNRGTVVTDQEEHADVITAKVTYKDGQEYYNEVRVDGQPVNPAALSGALSDGEFASILEGVFERADMATFRFEKEEDLHSTRVLVFQFHVTAQNNKSYYLRTDTKAWLPEYQGRMWIDKQNFQLLRLERETPYMADEPIVRMKTTIEYSQVALGDGSNLLLPTHSDIMICSPPPSGNTNNCSRNSVKFTNWHKFRATTNIVSSPVD